MIGKKYPDLAHKMIATLDFAMSVYYHDRAHTIDALLAFTEAGDETLTEKVVSMLEKHSTSNNKEIKKRSTKALVKLGRREAPAPPPKPSWQIG